MVRSSVEGLELIHRGKVRETYLVDDERLLLVATDRLPEPIFTPSTKAEVGHDENITRDVLAEMVGSDLARKLEERSLAAYGVGAARAEATGLILADTKFEFGWIGGELALIDEVLTPDSSRFWDAAQYRPGSSPPSFDKQYVRDFVAASGWTKEPPAPTLPPAVIAGTRERYVTAYERLTGRRWQDAQGLG